MQTAVLKALKVRREGALRAIWNSVWLHLLNGILRRKERLPGGQPFLDG
jgi:hypothetical protein